MPVQALSRWSRAEERPLAASDPYRAPWLARLFVFAGAAALTAYGAYEMYQVVSVSRTTVLQWLLLLLFTVNFSWIALAFTSGLLGFVSLLRRPRRLPPLPATLRSRTAVVMPVYNESTARTFAALAGDARGDRGDRARRAFRLFRAVGFDRSGRLDRRGARLPRLAPEPRRRRPRALPPPAEEPSPQGRQHRRFRHALGRRLRSHAGARRRQPDDRRMHRPPCPRHGGGPRRRHHPDAAADHQPQHAVRARAAVRRQASMARWSRPGSRCGRAGTATIGATTPSSARAPSRPVAGCPTFPAGRRSAATCSATISSRRR